MGEKGQTRGNRVGRGEGKERERPIPNQLGCSQNEGKDGREREREGWGRGITGSDVLVEVINASWKIEQGG